ncbi:hypothetical protein PLESTB_001017700 [Pleodorina starrii]|uniref:Uncharacterized protein n=1 Tax=Pleodorina starrii TaxID=330485 RepID=A0A9W6BP56_9CHLO|nr:hypothetical protein PLESTB_001017700 [Pleodorina starrii]
MPLCIVRKAHPRTRYSSSGRSSSSSSNSGSGNSGRRWQQRRGAVATAVGFQWAAMAAYVAQVRHSVRKRTAGSKVLQTGASAPRHKCCCCCRGGGGGGGGGG